MPQNVLIIDDDETLRFSLALALEDAGYRVQTSAACAEGLRLAQESRPGLVLCDVHLPEGDGRSVLKTLREDPELASCQFVLMTGDVTGAPLRAGMDLGADDYLAKPFTMDELLRCVHGRFQRAAVHRQAGERASRWLKESLAQKLPHEIFTPLTGILGFAELLRDDLDNLAPNMARDMVGEIHRSAERLHRTLKNYLAILDLRDEWRDPHPLDEQTVADAVGAVVRTAAEATAGVHQRVADLTVDCAGVSLPLGANNLASVVTELVDNACKFSPAGSPIAVRVRAKAGETEVAVFDHGSGLTPAQIARIEAFRQFDRSNYTQQGLGLGLTLAQHLVERTNGTLRIESHPGKGTLVAAVWSADEA